jgi:hypothetical protein
MKFLVMFLIALISINSIASDELKQDICKAFAEDNSGAHTEWSDVEQNNIEVVYDYNSVFQYCMDNVQPKMITDENGTYFEFELFVCGGIYQDETVAYDPTSKTLEYLGGSGSGGACPYSMAQGIW